MNNNKLPQVRLRNGFSDRNRIKEENKTLQYTDFDERTRISFCNTLIDVFNDICEAVERQDTRLRFNERDFKRTFCTIIVKSVYVEQIDNIDRYSVTDIFKNYFYRTIREDSYNAVLDLIEFFAEIDLYLTKSNYRNIYKKKFNNAFEYDFVGYRFVTDKIVAITDEHEIKAIEEAIIENPYGKCKEHFSKALALLADRNNKDYSNSIKESICAVENICQIIVGKSTSLGDALDQLEKNGIIINKVLKIAFDKMYGYTSDSGGIRHANAFNTEVPEFEDAKYMLVVCSAFVNYLIAKIAKIT